MVMSQMARIASELKTEPMRFDGKPPGIQTIVNIKKSKIQMALTEIFFLFLSNKIIQK